MCRTWLLFLIPTLCIRADGPLRFETEDDIVRGSAIATTTKLWTGAVVPYVINADAPQPQLILDAMGQWSNATGIQFVNHTNQPNFLRFARGATEFTCNSYVGMQGGEQLANIGASCGAVGVLHEIGHALGLWHEQTRKDRGRWVSVLGANVTPTCIYNFDIQTDSQDAGPYDFASVMHYYAYAFSRVGKPTLETIPAGIPIGEATGLSPGDITNVRRLYGQPLSRVTISTFPNGMPITVDGVSFTSTQSFDWPDGSTHTISTAATASTANDTRFLFGRWNDDGDRTHTVTAAAGAYVTASFVRQFRVTTKVTPASTGTITLDPPSPDGFYRQNQDVLITATPAASNFFWHWRGIDKANAGTYAEDGGHAVGDTNPRVFNVNLPKDVELLTTSVPVVTINTDPPNLWVQVDGNEMRAPIQYCNVIADNWQPGSTHTLGILRPTQTCRVLCESDTRWVFRGWSQGGPQDQTIAAPNGVTTLTAMFARQFNVQATANGGVVRFDPASADGYYDEGATVTATVQPSQGFRFREWFGQLIDLDLPTATVNANYACGNPLFSRLSQPLLLRANFETALSPGPTPIINQNGIVHGASFLPGPVAPGEIVTIFGSGMGPGTLVQPGATTQGFVDSCLAQSTFFFDGVPAPVLYTSATQAAVIVPYSVAGKSSVQVQADYLGRRSTAIGVPVTTSSPAVFTFNGRGLFLTPSFQIITPDQPAPRGDYAIFYASGEGQTNPAGMDGELVINLRRAVGASVTVGGVTADLLYAGSAPGFVAGLLQVNIRIPDNAPVGDTSVVLKIGSASSPTITIPIR